MYRINKKNGRYAVVGGAFLGGGGGGSAKEGFAILDETLKSGEILVKDIEEFDAEDIIVTASAVGSPASTQGFISVEQVVDNLELFKAMYGGEIKGIITNENGGLSTTNGWILSAATGIPLIDAPCNGRAHPTGVMGSMGIEDIKGYESVQVASGGKGDKNISTYVKGSMAGAAKIVRQAAVEAGGLVTVLRNPISAKYVRENAAPKSLKQAIEIGEIFECSENTDEIIEKLKEKIDLEIIAKGIIAEYELIIEGGFDYGFIKINDEGKEYKATFWNEFMTIDESGERIATFPDLIGCFDEKSGEILTSAKVKKGDSVYLYKVPGKNLILGAGMKNREQFELIENILKIEIVKYVFEE